MKAIKSDTTKVIVGVELTRSDLVSLLNQLDQKLGRFTSVIFGDSLFARAVEDGRESGT